MKYLNLPVSIGRDESMMRSTPAQIGVWFQLITYCHEQMNGGVIKCCHEWPDAMWQRIANTTASFIANESPLWHFSSMVLVIHHYDTKAEDAYRKKQEMGRIYVERRWRARHEKKIVEIPSSNYGNSGNPQKRNGAQVPHNQQPDR